MITSYYQNWRSIRTTFRALRPFYGHRTRFIERITQCVVDTFEATESVNKEDDHVCMQSIPRRSQELDPSQTTTWRILRCDLDLHLYEMNSTDTGAEFDFDFDYIKRHVFADWAQVQLETDPNFHQKMIFSDDAHNEQNYQVWENTNPHEIQ